MKYTNIILVYTYVSCDGEDEFTFYYYHNYDNDFNKFDGS